MAVLKLDLKEITIIKRIQDILVEHGFPNKKVSLPREKIQRAAMKRGVLFSDLLKHLHSYGIEAEVINEKVVFNPCASLETQYLRHNQMSINSVEYQGGIKPNQHYALGINVICDSEFELHNTMLRIREIVISWTTKRRIKAARLMLLIHTKFTMINSFHEQINDFYCNDPIIKPLISPIDFKVSYFEHGVKIQDIDF